MMTPIKICLKILLLALLFITPTHAQKPAVWLISDGGEGINDPDDISAVAGYLLMSNHFDTRAIVMGSTVHPWNKDTSDQKAWAEQTYGKAYAAGLENLNKYIGGFQPSMRYMESSLKGCGENFQWQKRYNLSDYPSIKALYDEVKSSKELINILCFGPLTEQAIFVSYCLSSGNEELLSKVLFISHWTSSNFHVGNLENPDRTHNSVGDPISSHYMKEMARNGRIKFYECGGIGQYGIVEGAPKGRAYYERFKMSELGRVFVEGKFIRDGVDDSDCATYFALLGNYGVSLNDIASNGLNMPEVERRNEAAFASSAHEIRKEMMRRSDAAAGLNPSTIKVDVIVPEHGMADAHAWVQRDTLWIGCGHDQSPDPHISFSMDRWEFWSTTNLRDWEYHSSLYPKDTYMGDVPDCFAGDITSRNGKYYWFFSDRTRSTGVAEADYIGGPYRDILGKALITPENGYSDHPYDPEIYEEDGVYTICYGSGTYYMATLAEDMRSMITDPKAIEVLDDEGNVLRTTDKSTLFKRDGWYYLVYGHRYAMSRELYGPYKFMGDFLNGGHTSFFEWHGEWYVLQENHETSAFYRGISLKPIFFNEDGSIIIPPDDRMFPGPGRRWDFDRSTMAWSSVYGTTLYRNGDGALAGEVTCNNAIIESAAWLYTLSEECTQIKIRIKNNSYATRLRIAIDSRDEGAGFWQSGSGKKDWSNEQWVTIPIESRSDEYRTYTIPLSKFDDIKQRIMQVALQPIFDTYNGTWEIDEISIE
ncbi:MAG: family 43 glycosylhydrolase [Rikenellaceae bacterium]